MNWPDISVVFFLSLILSLLLTPIFRKIALKANICDYPTDELKIHSISIPYLGGAAIFVSIITVLLLERIKIPLLVYGGISAIFLTGFFDDWKELLPKLRLSLEILVGILVVISGTYVFSVRVPFISPWFPIVAIVSVFAVVGSINSVNLMDGLDGLAGGVVALSSIGFFFLSRYNHLLASEVIALSFAGACLGFLPYNFPHAKIFLGDAGSYLCGFVLGYLFLCNAKDLSGFIAGGIIMGIFILDTGLAIWRRKVHHKPLFIGDREHLYDRVFKKTRNIWKTLATCYVLEIAFILLGISSWYLNPEWKIALLLLITIMIYILLKRARIFQ